MTGKNILVVFVVAFLALGVSADIVSINSGGSNNLVINPARYLEGFFFSANHAPVINLVNLFSSSGKNLTMDNLGISFTGSDADGDYFTNITDWRVNGDSIAVLNMPFDKNVQSLTTGSIRDYSSYENNGTLGGRVKANAPFWNSSCQVGGCYEFGNSLNREYIQTNSINVIHTNLTLSAWINPKLYPGERSTIILGSGAYYLSLANDGSAQTYWYGRNPSGYFSSGAGTVPLNTWTYINAVWDDSHVYLYINGVLKNTISSVAGTGNSASSVIVGAENSARQFNGSIDEVQIFNRALSSQQIEEMYQEGLSHHHVNNLVSSETHRGETWQVAVTPDDRMTDGETVLSNSLTIQDAAPNDPTDVNLVSVDLSNQSNANLNCSYFVSDPDDTTLTSYVRWYRNNSLYSTQTFSNQNNATTNLAVLGSSNLTLGDTWYCSVRSYDGAKYSNWVDSNNLTIIDTTPPKVYIISPNKTNYTTLNIDFNVTATDNEAVSSCLYSLDGENNVTMNRTNATYFWSKPNLGPGPHNLTYYCNDASGNWGENSTNFTIENSAAISVQLSDALLEGVKWNVANLPITYLDAIGNNLNNSTSYYINVSSTNTLTDIYVKADGDLHDSALDTLGLGNETYAISTTDSTVSNISKSTMLENYTLIGNGLSGDVTLYMKFYLNAPANQPAGTYLNTLYFKAVRHGQAI